MTEMNKKPIYLLTALLALLSCTREPVAPEITPDADWETPSDETPVVQELTAIFPADTRTSYSNNPASVGNFAWEEGDKIAIMFNDPGDSNNRLFVEGTLHLTSDPKVATVTYTAPSGSTRAYQAIYPFDQFVGRHPGYGWSANPEEMRVINYPLEYDISDIVSGNGVGINGRTYDTCQLPMYATNTEGDNQLFFKHFGSLLRIICNNVPAGTQKIAVSSNTDLGADVPYYYNPNNTPISFTFLSPENNSSVIDFKVSNSSLTNSIDGIVVNVPLFYTLNNASAYKGFKVSALDGSNKVLRQDMIDWVPITSNESGTGYRYSVSLTKFDETENAPYHEILFGGGTNTSGSEISPTSGSFTPLSLFLTSRAQIYIASVSQGDSNVRVRNYNDHMTFSKIHQNRRPTLNFLSSFASAPSSISKIVISCKASTDAELHLSTDSEATWIKKNVTTSKSNITLNQTSIPTKLTIKLVTSSANELDIYSIRFYFAPIS